MDKKNALMEAVAEKVGKRAPAFKRKGPGKPGLAVMIAVGAPKAGMKPAMKPEMKSPMGKDAGEAQYIYIVTNATTAGTWGIIAITSRLRTNGDSLTTAPVGGMLAL